MLRKRMRCSSVFVSLRLKSLALLPELLPLFHYEKGVTAVFGMESGFSLGAEGGTRRGLFAGVYRRSACTSFLVSLFVRVCGCLLLFVGSGLTRRLSDYKAAKKPFRSIEALIKAVRMQS